MAANILLTTFPGKQIWVLCALTFNFIRLPFWMLYYIPSSLRPVSSWSYGKALRIRCLKAYISNLARIEAGTPWSLSPGSEGARFATIHPSSPNHYQGISMSNFEIRPETIGGTWYPNRPSNGPAAGDVVLHFHGGAYVIGSGRTDDAGFAAKTIIANTTAAHVFCTQYRLACHPGGKFPAALQDAITSYLYLTETLRISAKRIVISGDSAGGNLVLALLRYIHDNPDAGLQSPGCAWLWSPWVDPKGSLVDDSHVPQRLTDVVDGAFGSWGARCLMPLEGTGITLAHPNICFLGTAFKTPTPLFFSVGECEMLFQDDLKTYQQFTAVPGNITELQIETAAVHDIILLGRKLGFEDEAVLAAKRAGEFWAKNR